MTDIRINFPIFFLISKTNKPQERYMPNLVRIYTINHDVYHSTVIIPVIKLRRIKLEVHPPRMEDRRAACKILVGTTQGKRSLGRPRRKWKVVNMVTKVADMSKHVVKVKRMFVIQKCVLSCLRHLIKLKCTVKMCCKQEWQCMYNL
jgi:hypothetical protein